MPRARYHLGRFLAKTHSPYEAGTSNVKEQEGGTEVEVQLSFWNHSFHTSKLVENQKTEGIMAKEEEEDHNINEFPIRDSEYQEPMKNINPSTLPHFHGRASKDPNTFIFEFEVFYRSYDYLSDAKKLKVFPSTLKDVTLRLLMSLDENNIESWERMKDTFMEIYRD